MGQSRFENISDEQLEKYVKYLLGLSDKFNAAAYLSINEFIENFEYDASLYRKVVAPLNTKNLTILDWEYLYYIFKYNDPDNLPNPLDRPKIDSKNVCFTVEETIYRTTTREEDITTYIPDEIEVDYLSFLSNEDEIYPYEWDITFEDDDISSIDDSYFELDC